MKRKSWIYADICFIWLTSLAVFWTSLSHNSNMKLLCKLGKEWRTAHTAWQLRSSSSSIYILVDADIVCSSTNGTDPVLKSTVAVYWHLHRFHLELAWKNSAQKQSHLWLWLYDLSSLDFLRYGGFCHLLRHISICKYFLNLK